MLAWILNLGFAASAIEAVITPELAMSTRNKIQFMADSRNIDFAYNDRRIEMPAERRGYKL
jgi:hypothetical protein